MAEPIWAGFGVLTAIKILHGDLCDTCRGTRVGLGLGGAVSWDLAQVTRG